MAGRLGVVSMLCCLGLIWAQASASVLFAAAGALPQFPPTGLPACGGNVAFPPDVRLVEPPPDVSPESAALVGVWEGATAEGANPSIGVASTIAIGTTVRLAVEEVAPGRARVVLGFGPLGGSPGSWTARVLPMTGGRMELSATPVGVFQLSGDRQTLNATLDRTGGRSGVRMTRCTMGETVVARSSPDARPSSATAPSAAALPAPGRVLYQDNFADPASGWPRQSNNPDRLLAGYESGEYYMIRPPRGPGWTWMSRGRESFADFRLEVEARLVDPTDGAYVSIGFHRQSNGDHYDFAVEPNALSYRLRASANDSVTTLTSRGTVLAIREGTATNRLGVWVRGDEIVLLINGQEVGRARDDRLPPGGLTLGAGNRGDGRTEVRYANLVVTAPE